MGITYITTAHPLGPLAVLSSNVRLRSHHLGGPVGRGRSRILYGVPRRRLHGRLLLRLHAFLRHLRARGATEQHEHEAVAHPHAQVRAHRDARQGQPHARRSDVRGFWLPQGHRLRLFQGVGGPGRPARRTPRRSSTRTASATAWRPQRRRKWRPAARVALDGPTFGKHWVSLPAWTLLIGMANECIDRTHIKTRAPGFSRTNSHSEHTHAPTHTRCGGRRPVINVSSGTSEVAIKLCWSK